MGNCYLKNQNQLPTTLPITSLLSSWHQLKLGLKIGLKKPITQLPITKTKKCRYEYMYGRELSLISFKIY